jgi:hypothetical protein
MVTGDLLRILVHAEVREVSSTVKADRTVVSTLHPLCATVQRGGPARWMAWRKQPPLVSSLSRPSLSPRVWRSGVPSVPAPHSGERELDARSF